MENLVLVHGLLGSLTFFEPDKHLRGINIIAPDLYGYGEIKIKEDLRFDDQVEFIKTKISEKTDSSCWFLGHSVGGAIVNYFAYKYPEMVKGIINVEGNYTINDAFWSQTIVKKNITEWEKEYDKIKNDATGWLEGNGLLATQKTITWAHKILTYQNALTVKKVSQAVVAETNSQKYKRIIEEIVNKNIPIYLIAGEKSVKGWDVPLFVKEYAKEFIVMANSGHMMMLEKPKEFCEIVSKIINK